MTKDLVSLEEVEKEIYEKRRTVRYDLREMMVETIVQKYDLSLKENSLHSKEYNMIYIPEYQRDFTWDEDRKSKFIESIILGLPIPFIFVAENKNSSWEIVDGSQRIRSIHSFVKGHLQLQNLPSIKTLNGYRFNDLAESRRGKILNTALKIIVLSEETTDDVKIDMFERINRGSDLLKPMEKRKGIYIGPFNDFIYSYCKNDLKYNKLVQNDKWLENRQEKEELLLRFFALSEGNSLDINVNSSISLYLDKYLERKNEEWKKLSKTKQETEIQKYTAKINAVNDFVEERFPYGYRHKQNPQTKRSVFEAISVGVWLVINSKKQQNKISKEQIAKALNSDEFKKFTHVPNELHKKKKLNGRIKYIYDLFIKA